MQTDLSTSVFGFVGRFRTLSEYVLANEGWAWEAYAEVRYSFLHLTLELRALAAQLLNQRIQQGQPPTLAQLLLAQHQTAFRDFESLMVRLDEDLFDADPAHEEWTLRTIFVHVHEVERYFLTTILNTLRSTEPKRITNADIETILGEPMAIPDTLPMEEIWANYERLHNRVLSELVGLTDEQLAKLSPMWEPQPLPISFRIGRFAAHLREHTNQFEKVLGYLNRPADEAKLLARQLIAALAEVEGALLGAGTIGAEACQRMASKVEDTSASLAPALQQIEAMIAAVKGNDVAQVQQLLAANPRLAASKMEDGLSSLLFSLYRGNQEMVETLQSARKEFSIFEAATLGNVDEINAWLNYLPVMLNSYAIDGFTPLQLAAFFGRPDAVQRLLAAGADVQAVAHNDMRIQPLHAGVAGRNLDVVKMLVEAGADVNAKQQGDFTPLMAAVQNGDAEMEGVLRTAGAE